MITMAHILGYLTKDLFMVFSLSIYLFIVSVTLLLEASPKGMIMTKEPPPLPIQALPLCMLKRAGILNSHP